MKKIITLTLIFALISCTVFCISVSAATEKSETTIEYLENGDYIEIIISDASYDNGAISPLSTNTITKTKTKYYKNSNGTILWSVSVTGTFTYNGTNSSCTSCSHRTTAPASSWSIKSASHSKSGNTATAKATATQTTSTGKKDYTMSVTIKCSAKGVVS